MRQSIQELKKESARGDTSPRSPKLNDAINNSEAFFSNTLITSKNQRHQTYKQMENLRKNFRLVTKQELMEQMYETYKTQKQNKKMEKDAIKKLPLQERNLLTREQRVMAAFEQRLEDWEGVACKFQQRTARSTDSIGLLQSSDGFRKKIELKEALEQSKTLSEQIGLRSWYMQLRRPEGKPQLQAELDSSRRVILNEPEPLPASDKNCIDALSGFKVYSINNPLKQIEVVRKPGRFQEHQRIAQSAQPSSRHGSPKSSNRSNAFLTWRQLDGTSGSLLQEQRPISELSASILQSFGRPVDTQPLTHKIANVKDSDLDDFIIIGTSVFKIELETLKKDGKKLEDCYQQLKDKDSLTENEKKHIQLITRRLEAKNSQQQYQQQQKQQEKMAKGQSQAQLSPGEVKPTKLIMHTAQKLNEQAKRNPLNCEEVYAQSFITPQASREGLRAVTKFYSLFQGTSQNVPAPTAAGDSLVALPTSFSQKQKKLYATSQSVQNLAIQSSTHTSDAPQNGDEANQQ